MIGQVAAHAVTLVAAAGVGALVTYVACSLHCEHTHHIETEQPPRF